MTFEWEWGDSDAEGLPVTRCACGAKFKAWSVVISIYESEPTEMPCCGRRVWWSQVITIHESRPSRVLPIP